MYDAIIVGAGMGGLVCGCYLARAGMKVLIAEQHYKPGGYCTSFKRQGFTFDAAAHSIGGYKYGNLWKIFGDLNIDKKVNIKRYDPTNIITTPDYRVSFWTDLDKTISEFQIHFPHESDNIKKLFYFLVSPNQRYSGMKNMTFKILLDKYLKDDKLKAILSFPLFGNGGLPPSLMSAFVGTKIFEEFLLGGGYYPEGGMQVLSNALAERFKEFGGELMLFCPVRNIRVKDNKVKGIIIGRNNFIPSKYVISNCDARQTFLKLLGKERIDKGFYNKLKNMTPSLSAFILYLGISKDYNELIDTGVNMWFLYDYDLDRLYLSAKEGKFNNTGYLLYMYPDKKTVFAIMLAPFKNEKYWVNNKEKLSEFIIRKIEKDAIPDLPKHIKFKDAGTPYTLYRYTSNYKGAAFGWECTPSQLADLDFRKPSFVQGFYLTGHWTTMGLGIPGVVYVSYDTAKMILRKEKIKHNMKIVL